MKHWTSLAKLLQQKTFFEITCTLITRVHLFTRAQLIFLSLPSINSYFHFTRRLVFTFMLKVSRCPPEFNICVDADRFATSQTETQSWSSIQHLNGAMWKLEASSALKLEMFFFQEETSRVKLLNFWNPICMCRFRTFQWGRGPRCHFKNLFTRKLNFFLDATSSDK